MKKILFSLMTLGLVVSLVGAGAFALFNDTETSEDNTFTAGTLDLKIGLFDQAGDFLSWEDDTNVPSMNAYLDWDELVNNLKPGDSAMIPVLILNDGTIAGVADIHIKNLVNYDNGPTEPEITAPANDATTANPGPGEGELGGVINVVIKYRDSARTEYDIYTGTLDGLNCVNQFATVELAGGDWAEWLITVSIDSGVGNIIQSDSVEFDVEFSLDQA